jgi:hydroxymethylglutaryl-CoA synthase
MSYKDFSYFCMHTPFSKMVQKSFYTLVMTDMETYPEKYDPSLIKEFASQSFKLNSTTQKLLEKSGFKSEWHDKCERSLHLAKMLGNIYTGSLYNGLISLICDDSIDLSNKKVMLFSYGSGCAASMFYVHVKPGYKDTNVYKQTLYKDRLNKRTKVSADNYDSWMIERETNYGKKDLIPKVSSSKQF